MFVCIHRGPSGRSSCNTTVPYNSNVIVFLTRLYEKSRCYLRGRASDWRHPRLDTKQALILSLPARERVRCCHWNSVITHRSAENLLYLHTHGNKTKCLCTESCLYVARHARKINKPTHGIGWPHRGQVYTVRWAARALNLEGGARCHVCVR